MHNVMEFVPPHVNTICAGIAASIASYVWAGGQFHKRVALPHARIMIHQPASTLTDENDNNIDLLDCEFESIFAMREVLVYSERTGKPVWIISQDLERDVVMSAKEAKAYGIIDHIKENLEKQNIFDFIFL